MSAAEGRSQVKTYLAIRLANGKLYAAHSSYGAADTLDTPDGPAAAWRHRAQVDGVLKDLRGKARDAGTEAWFDNACIVEFTEVTTVFQSNETPLEALPSDPYDDEPPF